MFWCIAHWKTTHNMDCTGLVWTLMFDNLTIQVTSHWTAAPELVVSWTDTVWDVSCSQNVREIYSSHVLQFTAYNNHKEINTIYFILHVYVCQGLCYVLKQWQWKTIAKLLPNVHSSNNMHLYYVLCRQSWHRGKKYDVSIVTALMWVAGYIVMDLN